eukprot:11497266-Alexandrium_andersonii.AAC.1
MSASLVGSEMCIRDSACCAPRAMSDMSWRWNGEAPTRNRPSKQTRSSEAVSYTHLTLPTICSV